MDAATSSEMNADSFPNGMIKVSTEAEVTAAALAQEANTDRANLYITLGALLAAPACDEHVAALKDLPDFDNPETAVEVAWKVLRAAAHQHSLEEIDDEFHELFVGLGRGIVVPYGSWHITGFLMEKPLSALREDLKRLGFERSEGVSESEDHIASLCQVMAGIITAEEIDFATEIEFFNEHIAPWAEDFFSQVQDTPSAGFYRAVAQLGQSFIEVEKKYLAMTV